MPRQKPNKVIIDTNVWISFLIGKELQDLKDLIVSEKVKVITTDQLINEIRFATSSRTKIVTVKQFKTRLDKPLSAQQRSMR